MSLHYSSMSTKHRSDSRVDVDYNHSCAQDMRHFRGNSISSHTSYNYNIYLVSCCVCTVFYSDFSLANIDESEHESRQNPFSHTSTAFDRLNSLFWPNNWKLVCWIFYSFCCMLKLRSFWHGGKIQRNCSKHIVCNVSIPLLYIRDNDWSLLLAMTTDIYCALYEWDIRQAPRDRSKCRRQRKKKSFRDSHQSSPIDAPIFLFLILRAVSPWLLSSLKFDITNVHVSVGCMSSSNFSSRVELPRLCGVPKENTNGREKSYHFQFLSLFMNDAVLS